MSSSLKPYADLKVKTREYKDSEGKSKGVYLKIGTLFASPHMSHMFITMEAIPIGIEWNGAVSVFKREEATEQTEAQEPQSEVEF